MGYVLQFSQVKLFQAWPKISKKFHKYYLWYGMPQVIPPLSYSGCEVIIYEILYGDLLTCLLVGKFCARSMEIKARINIVAGVIFFSVQRTPPSYQRCMKLLLGSFPGENFLRGADNLTNKLDTIKLDMKLDASSIVIGSSREPKREEPTF